MENETIPQAKEIILSVRLDFPIDVLTSVDSQDEEFFYLSFNEEALINKIKEQLGRGCGYKLIPRRKYEKD